MNKIKICHIITKLELGGAQQNTLYTLAHLNRETFEPVLISGEGGILDPEAAALKDTKLYWLPKLVRKISPADDLVTLLRLISILRKEKPLIVHTHSSKAGILGRIAAFIAGVPVIIHTFHGFGFHDLQPWPVKNIYIYVEKLTALISTKLIAVSKQNIQRGLANNIGTKEKYILIRSGIEISKYKNTKVDILEKKKELNIDSTSRIITSIGPFKPQKNLLDFVSVANLVSIKCDNCIFLVIGDGEERPALEKSINNFNLQGKVRLLGWRRDIAEILSITNVFVMTSLWEGLPRSCLEAMCLGLPIVANAIDGVREIVSNNENGFLVEPHNTARMAEHLISLINDNELAGRMGNKSREMIGQEFDIDYMVKQQEELYKSLVR